MTFPIQALSYDPASLKGLSEKLITSHHQNNYAGAVKRLNAIRAEMINCDFKSMPGYALNGIKREELIAINSLLLHELYFASLGGDGILPPPIELALTSSFGSAGRWHDEFTAMGRALGGGSGWVILNYLPHNGTLINQYASDHTQCVAGAVPILALDMYEHAYHIDFGANAAAYIDSFMANIKWSAVAARFAHAVHSASDGLNAQPDALKQAIVLDVRRAGVYEKAIEAIPDAQWRNPATISKWINELPRDRDIVVYCVFGHEVSRGCAVRLRSHGLNARFLEGGIEAWQTAGHPLVAKEPTP